MTLKDKQRNTCLLHRIDIDRYWGMKRLMWQLLWWHVSQPVLFVPENSDDTTNYWSHTLYFLDHITDANSYLTL